jgi:hypothetical protein
MLSKFSKEFSSKWGKWNLNTCNLAPVSIVSGTVFLAFHITTFLFIFFRGWKDFICRAFSWRKEKRKTAYWGMQGDPETGDPLIFF